MRLVRYRTRDQAVIAIAGRPGLKWTHLVWLDVPVRVEKVANEEAARYGTALPGSVRRAARQMLRAGKSLGITGGATKFLKEATQVTPEA